MLAAFTLLAVGARSSHALEIADYPALVALVETMVREDEYPRAELERILSDAEIKPSVIRLMNRQSEALPWHEYREIFINRRRIADGVAFWDAHEATLQRAAAEFGVPPKVVVALIGVETHFGTRTGDNRVLDSLVTLTADYPRRSAFFGGELRAFLNTARAEGIAADSVLGSFAGAIGIPQFMPTSYEAYAVDFNGNGRRDLNFDPEDAIGSVANYLKRHGWREGEAILATLTDEIPAAAVELATRRAKPTLSAAQLHAAGATFDATGGSDRMALLHLREAGRDRYIVGFRNFYAITRYNPSVNYAMAVAELAQQINAERAE
ncbi:MAG: lytic murein transglycosylase B [bacterium]